MLVYRTKNRYEPEKELQISQYFYVFVRFFFCVFTIYLHFYAAAIDMKRAKELESKSLERVSKYIGVHVVFFGFSL